MIQADFDRLVQENRRLVGALSTVLYSHTSARECWLTAQDALAPYDRREEMDAIQLPARIMGQPHSYTASIHYESPRARIGPSLPHGYLVVSSDGMHFLTKDGQWTAGVHAWPRFDCYDGQVKPGREYHHETWEQALIALQGQHERERADFESATKAA